MKKLTTLTVAVLGLASTTLAQQLGSDDPVYNSAESVQKIQLTTPTNPIFNSAAVQGDVFPCGGGTDTLVASGACSYIWSSDSSAMNVLSTSDSLIFGPVTSDTTVYLSTIVAYMDSVAPLPGQGSVFTGNIRGYHFTAPVDMIITGLWVPTDASAGNQTVAVLLFDNQTPPPLWGNTTNAFTELGYWVNFPAGDTISTCLTISAGDVVGIYGWRESSNSYATAPYQSMIGGIPTTFTRSGMQNSLNTMPMQNVFSETGGSLSRTEFFYDLSPDTLTEAVNIIVPGPEFTSATAAICQGDSILLEGSYQTTAGIYTDSLMTIYGCDSIVTTDLTVNVGAFTQTTAAICAGDSILLGGLYQTMAGTYTDNLQTAFGCDSTVVTSLTVNALPTIEFLADTLCLQDGSISLSATPTGGSFSGANVSGGMFDAASAGAGTHTISYDYTDNEGCTNSANATFLVEDCAGLAENTLEGVKVFPNPMNEQLQIVLPEHLAGAKANLYDAKGRVVLVWDITSTLSTVNVSDLSAGMYVVEILDAAGLSAKFRLVKK